MDNTTVHLLMMAVVQEQDVDAAIRALEEIDAPASLLTSSGGFLGRRNATLLIGLPDNRQEQVLDTLRKTCRQRIEYLTLPLETQAMPLPTPVPVTVGGATVFCLPVEQFEEF
jgi:uncharacterized protein YaaQ